MIFPKTEETTSEYLNARLNKMIDKFVESLDNFPTIRSALLEGKSTDQKTLTVRWALTVSFCAFLFSLIDCVVVRLLNDASLECRLLVYFFCIKLLVDSKELRVASAVMFVSIFAHGSIFFLYFFYFRQAFIDLSFNKILYIYLSYVKVHFCIVHEHLSFSNWVRQQEYDATANGMTHFSTVENTKNLLDLSSQLYHGTLDTDSKIGKFSVDFVTDVSEKCFDVVWEKTESACDNAPYGTRWSCRNPLKTAIHQTCDEISSGISEESLEMKASLKNNFMNNRSNTENIDSELFKKNQNVYHFRDYNGELNRKSQETAESLSMFGSMFDIHFALFLAYYALGSINYVKNYLQDVNFENTFVDRSFTALSKTVRPGTKYCLHPLRAKELENHGYIFGVEYSKFEIEYLYNQKVFSVGFKLVYIYCFILNIVVVMNFNDYIQSWNWNPKHFRSYIHFAPKFQDASILDNMFREFLSPFHVENLTSKHDFNIMECFVELQQYNWGGWLRAAGMLFLMDIYLAFTPYISRVKRLICDYQYPKQAHHRMLHLFKCLSIQRNDHVEVLVEFFDSLQTCPPDPGIECRIRTCRFGYAHFEEMTEPSRERSFVRFCFTVIERGATKHCICCEKSLTRRQGFTVCDERTCAALQCIDCFVYLDHQCYDCGRRVNSRRILLKVVRKKFDNIGLHHHLFEWFTSLEPYCRVF